MLRRRITALCCLACALLPFAGCSDEPSDPGDPSPGPGLPPPPAWKPAAGPGLTLAIDKFFLGDTDRDDIPNEANGWMQYGFNIDGVVSTGTSADLCQPYGLTAPGRNHRDGHDGIDNAFGNTLIKLIGAFSARPSAEVTRAILEGEFTLVVRIDALGGDSSYNPLTASLHSGATLASRPKWDGGDVWPVLSERGEGTAAMVGAKEGLYESYLVDDLLVMRGAGPVDLRLKIAGAYLNLELRHVIVTAQLDEERLGATNGTIAGVIETESLVEEARNFAVRLNEGFCSGDTVSAMLDQIRAASDIMKDGTQDSSRPCDGISIGVGFTAKPVQLGEVVPAVEAPDDSCP